MIKTIYNRYRSEFDETVNRYLAEGWVLNQPVHIDQTGYFAIMYREAE